MALLELYQDCESDDFETVKNGLQGNCLTIILTFYYRRCGDSDLSSKLSFVCVRGQ